LNTILQICVAILCLFFVWRIYSVIKANPGMLSKENLTKSFSTMGVLALILIGFITILVMLVKQK
jgi:hypothetical protein